jgi:hypothetical protein
MTEDKKQFLLITLDPSRDIALQRDNAVKKLEDAHVMWASFVCIAIQYNRDQNYDSTALMNAGLDDLLRKGVPRHIVDGLTPKNLRLRR